MTFGFDRGTWPIPLLAPLGGLLLLLIGCAGAGLTDLSPPGPNAAATSQRPDASDPVFSPTSESAGSSQLYTDPTPSLAAAPEPTLAILTEPAPDPAPTATPAPVPQVASLGLEVLTPADNSVVPVPTITVAGLTSPDAAVSVNGQLVFPDPEGHFAAGLSITPANNPLTIEVIATSIAGERRQMVLTAIFSETSLYGAFGTISEIVPAAERTLITLDTGADPLPITATGQTTVRIPGREKPSVGDLAVGDSVAVLLIAGEPDYRVAINILVKPNRPVQASHFVGIVMEAVPEGAVTLLDHQGHQVSASATGSLPDLHPGDLVTAVLGRDPNTGELLITALEEAGASLGRTQSALELAQQEDPSFNLEALKDRLAHNSTRHLTLLREAAHRAAGATQEAILARLQQEEEFYSPLLSHWGADPPSVEVVGIVALLDPDRGGLTVAPRGLEPVELSLTSPSAIQMQGRSLSLEELSLGQRVVARYDLATQAASRITVLPGQTLPLGLAASVLRTAGGAAGNPASVRFDPASLTLSPNAKELETAGVVLSLVPKATEELAEPWNRNLLVLTADGEALSLHHTRATIIRRDGRRVPINEVRLGDLVEPNTSYLAASGDLIRLNLTSPRPAELHGTVQGVVPTYGGKSQVTIVDDTLNIITLSVTEATVLTRHGKTLSFTDLGVGDRVQQGAYHPISLEALRLNLAERPAQVTAPAPGP